MGAPRKPATDAECQAIADLAAAGHGRNEIARRLGRSLAFVTKHAPAGAFDRSDTQAATQARKADLAARRTTVAERELDIVEALQKVVLDGLKGDGYSRLVRIAMGGEETRNLTYIPAGDLQQLGNARSSAVTIIDRLTRDESNDDTAKSLLVGLAGALGLHDPEPADAGA